MFKDEPMPKGVKSVIPVEHCDTVASYETELKKKQDGFLDSYGMYLKSKSSLHKNVLERKVIELEILDPTFTFRIE